MSPTLPLKGWVPDEEGNATNTGRKRKPWGRNSHPKCWEDVLGFREGESPS